MAGQPGLFGNELSPSLRNELRSDSVRVALRYGAGQRHDLIAVGTWVQLAGSNAEDFCVGPTSSCSFGSTEEGYALEASYFGRFDRTRATVGGSLSRVDVDQMFRCSGDCIPG